MILIFRRLYTNENMVMNIIFNYADIYLANSYTLDLSGKSKLVVMSCIYPKRSDSQLSNIDVIVGPKKSNVSWAVCHTSECLIENCTHTPF